MAQAALGSERVEAHLGAYVEGFGGPLDIGGDGLMENAALACEAADVCVLFLGASAITPHWQEGFSQNVRSRHDLQH